MRIFTTLKNNNQLLTGPKETSELFLTETLLIYSLFPVAIHYLIPPDSNIREKICTYPLKLMSTLRNDPNSNCK